jgi:hypothetical protein
MRQLPSARVPAPGIVAGSDTGDGDRVALAAGLCVPCNYMIYIFYIGAVGIPLTEVYD